VPHLVDVGVTPDAAARLLALTGLGAIGAQILLGYVADRWHTEGAFTLGQAGMVASTILLWLAQPQDEWRLLLYAATFSLGFATNQGIITLMVADVVPGGSLGKFTGLQAVLISLGVAIGPGVGGLAHDGLGSYGPAFVVALVCELIAVGCVWLASGRKGPLVPEPQLA
jgi:MFS family permease